MFSIFKCNKCAKLNKKISINSPSALESIIKKVNGYIWNETLNAWVNHTSEHKESVRKVVYSDIVDYEFKCNFCNKKYKLEAETYHGQGGTWEPM